MTWKSSYRKDKSEQSHHSIAVSMYENNNGLLDTKLFNIYTTPIEPQHLLYSMDACATVIFGRDRNREATWNRLLSLKIGF